MQQCQPMAHAAPDELMALYRQHQRSEGEQASNQLRLFARRLFAALSKKELKNLHGQAESYLE